MVLLWVYCFAMPCTAQVPKDVYGVPIVGTTTPAEASVMMVHAATSASATLAGSEVGRASHTVLSLGELPAQSALSAKLPPAVPMDVSALDQDEVLEMRLRSMFVTGNLAEMSIPPILTRILWLRVYARMILAAVLLNPPPVTGTAFPHVVPMSWTRQLQVV
jgi:hypothetical protein